MSSWMRPTSRPRGSALGDDGLVSLKNSKFADDESSGDNDDMIRKAAKKLKVSQRDGRRRSCATTRMIG